MKDFIWSLARLFVYHKWRISYHKNPLRLTHREAKLTMTGQRYQIRQCEEKECHFRFPIVEGDTLGHRCPKCGGKARLIKVPYTAHEVEIGKFVTEGAEVEALLDNIRSVFNVGNMLRTADGAGIRHMHLCGITPNWPKQPWVLSVQFLGPNTGMA